MDIRQIIEEKRDIFKAMDLAIDKTLNVQDAQMRKEGRLELDKLRGKDPAVPFSSAMRMNLNMIVLKIRSMPKSDRRV